MSTTASKSPRPGGRSVLIVAPSPPPYGGMALQAQLLHNLLTADGHEVLFCASNHPLPRHLRLLDGVPFVRTIARFAVMFPRLWRDAGTVETVHIFAASWWYFFLVVVPAVLVSYGRRRRIVLNYRGGAAEQFFGYYGWAVRRFFLMADVITAPSEFVAEPIRRRFGVPVAIIPNILDFGTFSFQERTEFRPKLLVSRHLEEIYDIESVIRAFRAVKERYPEASLSIAGTGSQEKRLRALVADWGLENVRFCGYLKRPELRALCAECDILVNASRVDNFPGALIEASAAGLAIVSTCAGGIPSIYRTGENALLVPVGDWEALAVAVQRVLESPTLGAKLTKSAREMVGQCEWRAVRELLFAAYGFASTRPSAPADAVHACNLSSSAESL
jgi:glycosyltransferase involved in cell wall biosynthesis